MAVRERDRADSPDEPRDPALDRAYAAREREEPPSHLDSAILAAARREVRAGPRPTGTVFHRWRAPVALAAVLVLSVSVVLLMRDEGADRLAESPAPLQPPASSREGKLSADIGRAESSAPLHAPSSSSEGKLPADPGRKADSDRRVQAEAPRTAPEVLQPVPPKEGTGFMLRDGPTSHPAPSEDSRRKEESSPTPRQEADRNREAAPRPTPGRLPSPPTSRNCPHPSCRRLMAWPSGPNREPWPVRRWGVSSASSSPSNVRRHPLLLRRRRPLQEQRLLPRLPGLPDR